MEGPLDEQELEEFVKLLEKYETSSRQFAGEIPEELQELMANVKRAKGQQAAAQENSQEITPQPGYVIKTTDQHNRKVFINVCQSKQVPAPHAWADGMAPEKVLKALEDLQQDQPNADAEAMRFALSCSDLQPDTDKQGQPCVTVDCILNSDIMAAVQQCRPLKAFVNELAINFVSEKHKVQLDPKYKLPKMSYKGQEVISQRIRLDPKSLVSDITSARDKDDEPSFPLVPSKAAAKKVSRPPAGAAAAGVAKAKGDSGSSNPQHQAAAGSKGSSTKSSWQHEITCEGRPVTHMQVDIQLPWSSSSSLSLQDVNVQLCGMQLKVLLSSHQQQQQQQPEQLTCCVQLPFAAAAQGAEAVLQCGSGKLHVKLPYLPVQQWVQQLEQEAPHAFSQLPLAHDSYMELDDLS